jgi:tRNA 2-thiouridine synthesizing protein A
MVRAMPDALRPDSPHQESPLPDAPAPVHLDLAGLKCPLPALRTRKALKGLGAGMRLRVTCTDPMSALDIPHLVQETGDELLAVERPDEGLTGEAEAAAPRLVFTIRKAG